VNVSERTSFGAVNTLSAPSAELRVEKRIVSLNLFKQRYF